MPDLQAAAVNGEAEVRGEIKHPEPAWLAGVFLVIVLLLALLI